MLKVNYSLLDGNEVTGFEMGYISFDVSVCEEKRCQDKQSVMIFLTISEIISGIIEYEKNNLAYKEISAVDSSLSISFVREDKSTKLFLNNELVAIENTKQIINEFLTSSVEFCKPYYATFHNSVKADLEHGFDEILKMI